MVIKLLLEFLSEIIKLQIKLFLKAQPFLYFDCPEDQVFILTGNPINCNLVYQTFGWNSNILVDYGDGSTDSFTAINTTSILITKTYSDAGNYTIIFQGSSNNAVFNYTVNVQGSELFY